MEVMIDKNIKYKGTPYQRGSKITIDSEDLQEFISNKIVDKDLLDKIQEFQNKEENKVPINDLKEDGKVQGVIDIDDITKDQIIQILTEKGIEHNNRDKKEILYELMIENV